MSTFTTIITFLKVLLQVYLYLNDEIPDTVLAIRIKKIKKAVKKASSGKLKDRLQGGKDVEDNFNRHAK